MGGGSNKGFTPEKERPLRLRKGWRKGSRLDERGRTERFGVERGCTGGERDPRPHRRGKEMEVNAVVTPFSGEETEDRSSAVCPSYRTSKRLSGI